MMTITGKGTGQMARIAVSEAHGSVTPPSLGLVVKTRGTNKDSTFSFK